MENFSIWDNTPKPIDAPACIQDLWENCPKSAEIQASFMKCYDHVESHEKIMCSISGGYDSDILIDLMIRCGGKRKTDFVFFDTGLEYDATKEHIGYLEQRYGIEIVKLTPKKAIPVCVKEYGVPFWSKYVSDMISRLQRNNFEWEDGTFSDLWSKYPRCKSALRWWCNEWGHGSRFNIGYTPGLKDFLVSCPPPMRISDVCCEKSKKDPACALEDSGQYDLCCTGVRKSEGGKRSTTYKSCFDSVYGGADRYRPLFWWTGQDKECYRKYFEILRSDCYEVWGMERTGCAGCPFGKDFERELELVQLFEPNRYRAMLTVFGKSYDYTRRFLEFREKLKIKRAQTDENQIEMEGEW